ncbi:MAG TPA: hypothetical protein VFD65_04765, partial [Chitinophagales bacterium]|nr:hypothetical protein [Chitinophagales bacterium]
MRKKVKSDQSTAHIEPSNKSFFNSKWTYLIVFAIIFLAAIIYYVPSIQGSSLSAHDYQQGRYNAHQLVEHHAATGEYAKWAPNLFSGMPSFQVWMSFNTLSSWITNTLLGWTNPYIFIGLLISISSVVLFYIMKVHPLIAIIGSFSLMFSNFTIVSLWAGHNNKVMVMSLVPLTLAGIWAVYERKKYLLGLFIISLSLSLQVRLNHVQITYFMMFLVGIWTLFSLA